MTEKFENDYDKEIDRLRADKAALLEVLKTYQKANQIHNDGEAVLFYLGNTAIAQAERKEGL